MRVPAGGASCLGVGRPRSGALPPPTARPLGGLPGPTTHWLCVRGAASVGTRHQPHSARSCELALRAVGAARGCPGGAPPAWVWGVRGRALSHPRLPALWAGCRGPLPTGCGCGGGAGVGTRHQPDSARSCELALRAVGAARGRPGGAPPAWPWGVRGRALSHPRLPALWAPCQGPLSTGCGCGGVWAWGPVTNPTERALACCRGGMRVPGGAASCLDVGRPGSGALPPRLPALWAGCRGPLPTGCWCGGVRAWGPVTNPTARALASWLCALWGRHEGARVGASCLAVGCPGSGALPPPTARPFRRADGARYQLAVGALCGRGGSAVLGILSCAAVRRVLCALPGFASPSGRCGLAPVLVPWLWPAACLSGVPRGPALVRCSSWVSG